MFWRREEGIWSREQLVAWLDVTSVKTSSEERGLKQVRLSKVRIGGGVLGLKQREGLQGKSKD